VFFAGGHGAAWDLPDDPATIDLTRRAYEAGMVVGAVCHGQCALVNVVLTDGTQLLAGRNVAAFTNSEEQAIGMTRVVPFLLSDKLIQRGAVHVTAPSFLPHVVIDGRLVTGQNPASATVTAQAVVDVLAQTA
jgi:putative intracellular protease/amidase